MEATIKSISLGGKELTIETGKIAKQADGACLLRYGESVVMVTAVSDKSPREGIPFLPLTVDYREKSYAAGKIPGGFFKREGRPTEVDILTCRIIDRSIRPLFKKGWNCETQVIGMPLSADPENPPDVLVATGASIALSLSDIPFDGPLATVRIGKIDGEFIINPSFSQLETSDMDVVITASDKAITMVEGESNQITESELIEALMFGFEQCQPIISAQKELVESIGKTKREFSVHEISADVQTKVREIATEAMKKALTEKEKLPRYAALKEAKKEIKQKAAELFPDLDTLDSDVSEILDAIKKELVRSSVCNDGLRLDGRGLADVRPIEVEVGFLPRTHGSALFTRGETQAIVITTLGTARDEQLVENLEKEFKRKFMLHYNFPPFCTAEVKFLRGAGRREIGHGKLAERSLSKVLPDHDKFAYTIRIVSEITESNGSSSMASVCGGSLSMMDAGVPLTAPVAGVAMGMMKEGDEFHVLTDILGDEDHLGDMDFKVTGTEKGITAVQMDIKIAGVDSAVLEKALGQARDGRLHILGEMAKVISEANPEMSRYAPRITTVNVRPERIKDVIGPGGRVIKEIIAQTGCSVDIEDDGSIKIGSSDPESTQQAIDMIKELTQEAEVGKLYMGTVRKITDFGAFCEVLPGTDGLLHISELSEKRVEKVTDVLREGDEVLVKVVGIDRQGKIRLSRKEALGQQLED